jgi:large subunit ribosomal protein L10
MGDSEVAAAAKVIKNFEKEFKKPEMKIGLLGNAVLDGDKLKAIADIPSREAVLSPTARHHPRAAPMIARVIKNKFDPDGETSRTNRGASPPPKHQGRNSTPKPLNNKQSERMAAASPASA